LYLDQEKDNTTVKNINKIRLISIILSKLKINLLFFFISYTTSPFLKNQEP